MLAADTNMQLRINRLTKFDSHLHQFADTCLIQLGEWIVLEDLGVIVSVQELACIITGEAEGHLSQVVGTEAEEVRLLAISSAVRAALGISIMVPTSYFRSMPAAAISASAVSTTIFLTYFSSLTSHTSGIMISGYMSSPDVLSEH